jgi:hypothetical protein
MSAREADSLNDSLENVGASMSHKHTGFPWLLQGYSFASIAIKLVEILITKTMTRTTTIIIK